MRCVDCPVAEHIECLATGRIATMLGVQLCHRLAEPGFADELIAHALPPRPTEEPIAEDPDAIIARVEEMGRRALAGERGGCGGCP